ncbi:hypothetical protein GDO81_020105 [Engystomops pustulosus]|uniref:Uncharacterized protein n=1 Tax=Engystomops pustulosus TaxID=76066 RepID=A0AAV6YR98_ENGPU|nr:hypothetical protein GDO81_020105 [Engystomops pustulosus]
MVSGSPNLQKISLTNFLAAALAVALVVGKASGHPEKRSMHTSTYSYVPLFGSWMKSICSLWKGYSGLGVTFCGVFTTLPGLWRAQTIQASTSLVTGVVMPGANHWRFMSASMAILDVCVCPWAI